MSRRAFTPKVVTANRLLEGDVVWMTPEGGWSARMSDALLIGVEAVATERLAAAEAQSDRIVGPYLADATPGPDGPRPVHFREAFRTRGPSNYAHGKQAEEAP